MKQEQFPALDVVLPCFQPREGWEKTVVQSLAALREALPQVPIRLILVNDGSKSGIEGSPLQFLQAQEPSLLFVHLPTNMGKGFALRAGVAQSTAPICLYTDVDFPYGENGMALMYATLARDEADVLAGVRDESYYDKVPPGRKRISKFLRWMLKTLFRLKITDTQCGLKSFNAKGKSIFLQTKINRFLFDMEFIFLASRKKNLRLHPLPVTLKPGIVFSKVNGKILIREGFNFFRVFFKALFSRP